MDNDTPQLNHCSHDGCVTVRYRETHLLKYTPDYFTIDINRKVQKCSTPGKFTEAYLSDISNALNAHRVTHGSASFGSTEMFTTMTFTMDDMHSGQKDSLVVELIIGELMFLNEFYLPGTIVNRSFVEGLLERLDVDILSRYQVNYTSLIHVINLSSQKDYSSLSFAMMRQTGCHTPGDARWAWDTRRWGIID